MNDIHFQLNGRQSVKQTAEEAKAKKEGNNEGEKKERNLEQVWKGRGMEKHWAEWLNISAIATHAEQTKTQEKYVNTCLVSYENTAQSQCHQTKRLPEVTEK